MKRFTLSFVFALVVSSIGCMSRGYQFNGANGPEVVSNEGPLGGNTTVNGGPVYNECMKYAGQDPRLMPYDKFVACRSIMPSYGAGMYGPGGTYITPHQAGMMGYPGSAAFATGAPPPVYGSSTSVTPIGGSTGSTGSGKDKLARKAIIEQGNRLNKLEKKVCKDSECK